MQQQTISCPTKGEGDIIDITQKVTDIIISSGIRTGLCNLFVTGSTSALTTIEYEPGVLKDLSRSLTILAPSNLPYDHDNRWGDGNGRSHVKAALVGPSLTVPISEGRPILGTWQQIVLLELDTRARKDRNIVITIIGESDPEDSNQCKEY